MAKLGTRGRSRREPEGQSDVHCRLNVHGGGELKLQARFGRQLQMLLAAARDRGAGHAADGGADRRAFAAAGDAADDGAEAGAAADLAAVFLPSPLPLVST